MDDKTVVLRLQFQKSQPILEQKLPVKSKAHYTHYAGQFAKQELLKLVLDACYAMQKTVELPLWMRATMDDINKLKYVLVADYPELWFVSLAKAGSGVVDGVQVVQKLFLIDKKYSLDEIRKINDQLRSITDAFIAKIEAGKLRAVQIEQLIHNFITRNVKYRRVDPKNPYEFSRNIVGCLVKKQCVCQGIALAFKYLCDALSLDCLCVTGTLAKEPHMWNMVRVDGEFYHVDVTSDLQDADYVCFNVPDRLIYVNRTRDADFAYPETGAGLGQSFYSVKDLCVRNEKTALADTVERLLREARKTDRRSVGVTLLYDIAGFDTARWVEAQKFELGIQVSRGLGRLATVQKYCVKQALFVRYALDVSEDRAEFTLPEGGELQQGCVYVLRATRERFLEELAARCGAARGKLQLAQHGPYLVVRPV